MSESKRVIAMLLLIGLIGCGKPKQIEPGYHHLMSVLTKYHVQTCEKLEHGDVTCLTFQGHDECGKTRDSAAEAMAAYIEKNYKAPEWIECDGCKPVKPKEQP